MRRRALCGLLTLAFTLLPATRALADPWATDTSDLWTVTIQPDVALRAGPDTTWRRLELMREGTPLRVLSRDGDWAQVLAPRLNTTGYVRKDLLGPSDTP